MRSILHTIKKATLSVPQVYSYSLKAAYILSDETVSIGFAIDILNYKHYLNKLSIKDKSIMMRDAYDRETESEDIKNIDIYLSLSKIKHVSTDFFKELKKMEGFLNKLFKHFCQEKKDKIEEYGFYQFDGVSDGVTFGFLSMKEELNSMGYEKKFVLDLDSFLQMKIPDTDSSDSIMVLNDWFYRKPIIKDHLFKSPLDISGSESYIYRILQLPCSQNYTTLELKATRTSLTEPLRKLISKWSILCNTSEDNTASLTFFKDKIVPLAESVNYVIKNHPVMKYHFQQFKSRIAYVFFGEVTKELLLNYYKYLEYIDIEIYQDLKTKYQITIEWDRRVPVMFISGNKEPSFPLKKEIVEDEIINKIIASRKFISLD